MSDTSREAFNVRMLAYESRSDSDRAAAFAASSNGSSRTGRGIAWLNDGRATYANGDYVGSAQSGGGESGIPDGRDSADRMHATTILKLARGTGNSPLPRETMRVNPSSRAMWVDTVAREALDNLAASVVVPAEEIMRRVVATRRRDLLPAAV